MNVRCARCAMIVLVFNLLWLPTELKADLPEPACSLPIELGYLQGRQSALYDWLGWTGYDICEDMFLLTDQEVLGADPNLTIQAGRGTTNFEFTVISCTLFQDWANYDLNPNDALNLLEANASANVFLGRIGEGVEFVGLACSFDDPVNELPRTNALCVLDWRLVPPVEAAYYNCIKDPEGYADCLDNAQNERFFCRATAQNDFDRDVKNLGIEHGVGTLFGCVIGAIKSGGPISIAAIKAILIGCGIGFLAGLAASLWLAYNNYKHALKACENRYARDVNACRIKYCEGVSMYPIDP